MEEPNNFGLEDGEIDSITKVIAVQGRDLVVEMKSGRKVRRSGGTISWRCNNPGNLKYGDFSRKNKSVGAGPGNHAVFPTYFDGLTAQEQLLFAEGSRYINRTIAEAIAIYAPVSDPDAKNDPIAYANFISRKIGVHSGTVLRDLNDLQRVKMMFAMHQMEGFKVGTEVEC